MTSHDEVLVLDLNPIKVRDLSIPERSVWGLIHYMQHGWDAAYGVPPPVSLEACQCPERITVQELADLLEVEPDVAARLVDNIIEKEAAHVW